MDLYRLSQDSFYETTALGLVANYAKAIDPKVDIWYKTSSTHPYGYYRPEDVLEEGLALLQAGTQFNNSTWVQMGQQAVNFVYSHAYISQYHTFAFDMDRVLNPNGSVNSSESYYFETSKNYLIAGNITRVASIAQIVTALLQTYQISRNQDFLNKAEDLLNPFSLPGNSLGLWDSSNLGYFISVTYTGKTPQRPGRIIVDTTKKEAGRQLLMLWAFHLADQLVQNKYTDMESKMLRVARTKAYYAPGYGVLYEVAPNWQPLIVNSGPYTGKVSNWVTTEAMGIELEVLFEVNS